MERKHPHCMCEECTLQDRPFVPTFIPTIKQVNVLFCGQAPGETESYTKIPFTGSAGKMHYSLMRQAGLKKDILPHMNIVSCYPPGDRKPTPLEMRCCFPRVLKEIHEIKPQLIVALGDSAMEGLTGLIGITTQRGRFVDLKEAYQYQCKVLCTLHPSFVMRQRQWIDTAVNTLALVFKYLKNEINEELNPELILDPDEETLKEYLNTTEPVGTDTETTGLNTLKDTIIGHSFSKDLNTAVAVYYTGPDDPRLKIVKEYLEDDTKKKIWQNGSYDTEIARTHGILDQGFYFDTRLGQQILHSDLPSDLDFLRAQYTQIRPYKPPKSARAHIIQWAKKDMLEYAAWDAITTLAVYREQIKLIPPNSMKLIQKLLIPLVRTIGRMERRGVRVDVKKLAGMYSQCQPKADAIAAKFYEKGINPRSPIQLKSFFGLKSTDEEMLEAQIKRNHPMKELMQELLDYRSLNNLASKYLKGIFNRLVEGRIHTHFKIEGTGTGRLSSADPNLQNVPEEMRVIYIPDEDHIFINADYSQIELWVGAIMADEKQMLKDLQDGLDIHYIACQLCFPHIPLIYGTRKKDFTKIQGLIAKTVTFGTFYGRSPHSISREFGVTVAEASSWQLKMLNKYPGLLKYKERCERAFQRDGFLTTPWGRIRYLESVTQGYNFPVQSSASDITLEALVKTDAIGLTPILSVHDSILFQVAKINLNEEAIKIKGIMERKVPQLQNINFKVTYDLGSDWYNMKGVTIDEQGVRV